LWATALKTKKKWLGEGDRHFRQKEQNKGRLWEDL
jgi:hypothetical protein